MEGVAGVMLMEIRLGAWTDKVELPVTCSNEAEITAVPELIADTSPAAFV